MAAKLVLKNCDYFSLLFHLLLLQMKKLGVTKAFKPAAVNISLCFMTKCLYAKPIIISMIRYMKKEISFFYNLLMEKCSLTFNLISIAKYKLMLFSQH